MTGPTLDQFVELYGRWARAVAERDRAALDALFASDYRYTSPEGDRLTRRGDPRSRDGGPSSRPADKGLNRPAHQ